jgi:transcription elongation factor GreA
MTDQYYLTAEGAARMRVELEQLKGHERDEIAKRLRSAIQMGDLSENADYHKAKEDQAFLEGRIQELEYLLKNAEVVEKSDLQNETVEIGAKITIQEAGYPPEVYHLVGVKEADSRNGRISHESPIGSALLGHRVDDEVIAKTPAGEIHLRILKIE